MEDIEQIISRLSELGVDVNIEDVENRYRLLVDKFQVPPREAQRSVLNFYLKEKGIALPSRKSEQVKINQIREPGRWVDLEAKVLSLFESPSPAISQAGILGDDTGNIRFVKWAKSGQPDLVEGKSYLLKNLVTDEFQGRFSVKINRSTEIAELDREIESVVLPQSSADYRVVDISGPGQWINLRAKVVQLWEPSSESIQQQGLLGDETGVVRFVKWAKSGQPDLVEGKSYLLKNLVTDEFQGRFSVKINRSTVIEETDEPIEVSLNRRITGAIVDIQKGSGLIKRCPTCRRPLSKGMCTDHGKVEGVYDLRVKAVIDDGLVAQDILINRERVEELIGLTMEQAKEMAIEALDHEVVLALIEEKLIGRYFEVTGPVRDRYLLVDSINEMTFSDDDVSLLVSRAEGL
ncbi:MAG: replication protein A [Methanothrix sp.]|uniref:Single-stranded DNA-binding replication protein A n=1 Tax=Methanothrix thermoacetophila (strain DSM 6194 / JCM 14653 / NBRC 101360 / PT) TaxID=349307 RepID=A0B943_METTP|nr:MULTISPECIES: replication protein A [Methanothrix]ABK15217.1 single-stranded DNA-binding replication protein A [Methanothrix thermoacetophila PT]MBC7079198.1 replication protein A [Methanothrix sp.]NPU86662.1 replication protein A [Methanothrix sp.]